MVVNPVCELIVLLTVSSVFYSNSTHFYIMMLNKSYTSTALIMPHQPVTPNLLTVHQCQAEAVPIS